MAMAGEGAQSGAGEMRHPLARIARLLGVALCLSLAACTTNPATGKTQLKTLMSADDEAQAGAAAHPKILLAYGGVYGDERVNAYVAGVTSRIVKGSDAPASAYRVTVLNSPVVNAFALPGGYVYVTRGLLALVDDEAELAGVLGHEIGHVIARHSAQRQTAALGASVVGALLGAVVGSPAAAQVVGQGSQGVLASYSRDQEFEADALGVRYLARAHYDPYAEADFLEAMGEQEKLHAAISHKKYDPTRMDWLASHPATPDRVAAARNHAAETGILPGAGDRNRDVYLHAIDGLLYGDSPDQGMVRGRTFVHPKLRVTFTAPPQFTLVNAPDAVIIEGPDKTIAKFDAGSKVAGIEIGSYLANIWAEDVPLAKLERFTVNGMPAATAQTKVGAYNARLVAIEAAPDKVYRFLMGTMPDAGSRYDQALHEMVVSFRRISEAEALAAKPLRIRVVKVGAKDSVASLAARMDFADFRVERFRALNGLAAGTALRPGQLVKLVAE
ncbi:MAG: M48 family metalloprotease [Parvibaculum sp.]|uniref:M48 family metalloprotease n=1 Tax=Parvibaculum sp. TaxID=2024848 RepID=UPI00283EF7ED|nr:M48 family metalloprotease [Parvibaculum sp.]MDR3497659.1 M48 family metalloprotease [Parvibaculum sp.]